MRFTQPFFASGGQGKFFDGVKEMNPVILLKRFAALSLILFFMLNLSACIMMPFMMPFMMGTEPTKNQNNAVDPKVNEALNELVQESVNALVANRGPYERILMGEVKVYGDLMPVKKLRKIMLETLHSKSLLQVVEQDERVASAQWDPESPEPEYQRAAAVLNAQFYHASGQLWLSLQLVAVPSNRIFWSGSYFRPEPA